MSLRSANPPRQRLLVHLSQAVETLSLRKEPDTHLVALEGRLCGSLKLRFFRVDGREFDHFEDISEALIRLDEGIYGRCDFCDRRIEEELLARMPWATKCLQCADREPDQSQP